MLTSNHRLRAAKDIARVYRTGSYGNGSVLSVKAAPSATSHSRFVVVVGKKVSKRAVIRNRLRRRLVEIVRTNLATVAPGYDIVITVHANFHELSPAQLHDRLMQALGRAKVLNS